MAWLELSIRTRRKEWRFLEPALDELGALAVTLTDAADTPILEPAPGDTPLWPDLMANALFDGDTDQRGLLATLQELVYTLEESRTTFRVVEDADWTRAWMDQYQPMRFGERLWIYPSTMEPPANDDQVVVRLDPGLAFGSGTHQTTALCLQWLESLDLAGKTVLDYGCGSGVLAIAALKLGAARAIGVDNDPQALIATRDNAERNGVAANLICVEPGDAAIEPADVVVANILAGALIDLAPTLIAAARPGAAIALSGVLEAQCAEVAAAYDADCGPMDITLRDEWARIAGRRHGA